jgi:hypothetical protein
MQIQRFVRSSEARLPGGVDVNARITAISIAEPTATAPAWPADLGVETAALAETIVPSRRRGGARKERGGRAAELPDRSEPAERAGTTRAPEARPDRLDDPASTGHEALDELDDAERGRLVSLIVFWAPAMILLLLAAAVIWVVR